ncbi:hypothetical protein L249_6893 [Ophiocordyceps polyrhachis-furcata BCC 54312]|uniref:Isopenicillin N synthase-like Fe(2+) 2OG dioxygenase domain-containing protein n=1 Tax=Ophiocordyceps polyrhachis-furcata BCC 54312 TaxID=1330021 RepID=A0A367LJS8_9HYPO|nr:hypothetical protein L249_6893 [Ophiocordyceps polyrhachis-furcata BCC 54312]
MTQLPEASSVTTVSLDRLAARDSDEMEKLLKAAAHPGYFYLDLGGEGDVAGQTRRLYAVADRYFDQPAEAKMRDVREGRPASSDRGFKSCVTDESFEMSTDEMRQGTLHLPTAMSEQGPAVNSFHERCHSATLLVLQRLADGLDVPLTQHHGGDESESGLKLIAEPAVARAADVVENKHRDSGTLTMLFYDAWSLHVCLSAEGEEPQRWTFVPPPPDGCALVHGASTLSRMTGGRLCAPLHRVTQPADGAAKRFFLSYFLRPDHRLSCDGPVACVA